MENNKENDKEARLRENAENFVAAYLNDNLEFFRTHVDLFLKLIPPRQNKEGTRSVLECQNDVLRASLAVHELKEHDAQEAATKAEKTRQEQLEKVMAFGQRLCAVDQTEALPDLILAEFMKFFGVRKGTIRLWSIAPEYKNLKVAKPVEGWIKEQISSMRAPYIGENAGPEIAEWTNSRLRDTKGVFLAPLFGPKNKVIGFICLTASSPKPFQVEQAEAFVRPALKFAQSALMRFMA